MAVEKYTETVPTIGAGPGPIERGTGNFLLVLSATAAVTVSLIRSGMMERYSGIVGGLLLQRVKPWQNLRVDGPAGTSVTFHYGNEITPIDVTDIRIQVATLTGVSLVADSPAGTLNDVPALAALAGTVATLVAANLARRRLSISADPNNTAPVYFRKTAGGNKVGFVMPGAVVQFLGTYGLDYDNTSAANQTLYLAEEA